MHSAPAVVFPLGRSRFELRLMTSLLCIQIGTLALWMLAVDSVSWLQISVAAWMAFVFVWMLWSWWQTPTGHLSWDGTNWLLALPNATVEMPFEPVLDLQIAVLLRFHQGRVIKSQWVWLEKSAQSERWAPLRRAIYGKSIASADVTHDSLQTLSPSSE